MRRALRTVALLAAIALAAPRPASAEVPAKPTP